MEKSNLNIIEKIDPLAPMEKIISKNYTIYYIPNCDKKEEIYYEFYRLKIQEYIKNKLFEYKLTERTEILSLEWCCDIMSMHYYSTDEENYNLEPLKYFIERELALYENKEATTPNELFNGYYLGYMDDTPYICEKIKRGKK